MPLWLTLLREWIKLVIMSQASTFYSFVLTHIFGLPMVLDMSLGCHNTRWRSHNGTWKPVFLAKFHTFDGGGGSPSKMTCNKTNTIIHSMSLKLKGQSLNQDIMRVNCLIRHPFFPWPYFFTSDLNQIQDGIDVVWSKGYYSPFELQAGEGSITNTKCSCINSILAHSTRGKWFRWGLFI